VREQGPAPGVREEVALEAGSSGGGVGPAPGAREEVALEAGSSGAGAGAGAGRAGGGSEANRGREEEVATLEEDGYFLR
jgi:hypothetical protein